VTENFAAALEDVELDLVAKLSRINQDLNDAVKEENKQRYSQIKPIKRDFRTQQKRDDLKKIAGIVEKLKRGEAEYDEKHTTFEVPHRLPHTLIL
jgi:hypothetical protein